MCSVCRCRGCRSQTHLEKPAEMVSYPQITLAELLVAATSLFSQLDGHFVLLLPFLADQCQNPALLAVHCCHRISFPLFPLQVRHFCASFSPQTGPALPGSCSTPCSWLFPSHPSTFPCDLKHPFLFLVHISLLPVYKAFCKVPSPPSPRKVLPCSESCLGNKASVTRRIAILK